MGDESLPVSRKFDRLTLLIGVTAATIGLGMVTALLAELQDKFGFENWGLGLITGASYATAFLAYMFLSKYSDRGHARLMFLLGGGVTAAGLVWLASADSLVEFVTARGLIGLGEGMFVPAARRIVLDWNPNEPGRELGAVHAAAVAGFVVGPLVGAILVGPFGLSVPFLIPAVAILIALPIVGRIEPAQPATHLGELSIGEVLRRPMVQSGVLLGASAFAAIGAIDTIWARLLTDRGASTTFIGVSFTLIVLPLAILAPLGGRLSDRLDPRLVGLVGSAAILPAFVMYGQLKSPYAIATVGAIHSVLMAAVNPAAATAVARGSPPQYVARLQGILDATGFVFAAISAVAVGLMYSAWGVGVAALVVALGIGVLVFGAYWASRRELAASGRSKRTGSRDSADSKPARYSP